MSILASLGDLLTGGGLTGVLSGGISAWAKYKEKKLELAQEKSRWKYEIAMHRLQAQSDKQMAEYGLLIAKEQGEAMVLDSAIRAEAALSHANLPWWVGAIRTLFRPWMTTVLWFSLFMIALALLNQPEMTLPDPVDGIVDTIRQGAALTLGFWFGGRIINAR